jgi:nitrite reductase (NO-forming)
MLENSATTLNQDKPVQNLAIFLASVAAVAIFILTINSLGLFHFGPRPEAAPTNGGTAVQAEDFKFVQQTIRITAGTEVELELLNADILPHSFDVDELNLHLAMPSKDTAETILQVAEPGTYTFYCSVPGHRQAGMTGTLIVEPLIVGP